MHFQLAIITELNNLEKLEDAMMAAGAMAVTIADAGNETIIDPSHSDGIPWKRIRVTGLFDEDKDMDPVKDSIQSVLKDTLPSDFYTESVEDRDWVSTWMENFRPIQFGKRLWVVPEWCTPPDPSAINILINPGQAFGTGTHPTTALCLEWIEGADLQGLEAVDYGCGSGILAIALAKSGAHHVKAVDNDPQALIVAQENVSKNRCSSQIAITAPESASGLKTDVIIANILANPLIALAEQFAGMLHPNGTVILSGILKEQVDEVTRAYEPFFEIIRCVYRESWVMIEGRLK